MRKILTVVGARPQFVKAAMVSRVLKGKITEILVHTGQHYDLNMSEIFFSELGLPQPDYHLGIGSGTHGVQTGKMLAALEEVLITEQPEAVLVYGDTNSTLAGALTAAKLHIPVAHVEAGLRSFNRRMPEEINRIVTDHLATWLFPPTETAVRLLAAEGITEQVHLVGDVMYDAFLLLSEIAAKKSDIIKCLNLTAKDYYLLTLHRAENTDLRERLETILTAVKQAGKRVIFPIHPRTRVKLKEYDIDGNFGPLELIEPVGYFDMLNLEQNAGLILTDSGGVQKEAYMAKVPCITLRDETEWVETVAVNWNRLVGAETAKIQEAMRLDWVGGEYPLLFGEGTAAEQIVKVLEV